MALVLYHQSLVAKWDTNAAFAVILGNPGKVADRETPGLIGIGVQRRCRVVQMLD